MKLSNLNLGLLLLSFLTITACSKNDDAPSGDPSQSDKAGTMTAKVGEKTFSSSNAVARYRSTGEFTIAATTSEGESLFFVIDNFIGVVDYILGVAVSNTANYSYKFNGETQIFSTGEVGTGVLTVTSYNESTKQISGTFTLTLAQEANMGSVLQITEGKFKDVPIKTLKEPAPGTMAYYADDKFYTTTQPNLSISTIVLVEFSLPTPSGDENIRL